MCERSEPGEISGGKSDAILCGGHQRREAEVQKTSAARICVDDHVSWHD